MHKQRQIRFRFEAVPVQAGETPLTKLYIYDDVTSRGSFNWSTWEYDESETSSKFIRDQLNGLIAGSEVEVHINSAGGEVAEGVAIYNLIKQASKAGHKIIGYIDGIAYSAAMVIAMACDEIHMGLGTSMLLHYPWMYCSGNAEQLRAYAEQLDALGESSLQLFLNRAGDKVSHDDLDAMMAKETMLTPEQAVQYGFADLIDTYQATPASLSNDDDKDATIDQLKKEVARNRLEKAAVMEMLESLKPQAKAITPEGDIPEVVNMQNRFVAALMKAAGGNN